MIVDGQEKLGKVNRKWRYFHVMDDLLGAELSSQPVGSEASPGGSTLLETPYDINPLCLTVFYIVCLS